MQETLKRGGPSLATVPKRPGQHRFDQMTRRSADQASRLVGKLGAGMSAKEFGDRFAALLESRHTAAVVLGRQRAGDLTPREDDDGRYAAHIVDAQTEYLDGFVQDILGGRYGPLDALDLAAIERRALMYVAGLRTTANEVFALALAPTTLILWVTTAAESCSGCLEMAAGSPYLAGALPSLPGQEKCLSNCHCFLETVSGLSGFQATEL